jgi:hypothetical protein
MKSVHLAIPDLFLPQDFAADVCAGLTLPALEKMLGRGRSESLAPVSLEQLLCVSFGIAGSADESPGDAPIAAISAAFDGLAAGYWLRADPVNLNLQRDQLLLNGVRVVSDEAAELCAGLNSHFAGQGIEFHAPHPQRWYLRLNELPHIRTTPLSQALGNDVRRILPAGEDAARWHQLFNEIQMLLHAHPVNDAREARGDPVINSLWFWGAAHDENVSLAKSYDRVSSDDVLVEMFAKAADIPFSAWTGQWHDALSQTLSRGERGKLSDGRQLLVWTGLRAALQRGDLAGWRTALQGFENGYAQPLVQALRSGKITNLQLDVVGGDSLRRMRLTRGDTWAFWRRDRRLAEYSMV